MRIAIVNDQVMAIETLRRIVSSVPSYDVAWVARDGAEAIAQCATDLPDLILMDLLMPILNGVEATRQIMQRSPCAILIVTASVETTTTEVFEALGCGALDAVNVPVLGIQGNTESAQNLLNKIATIGKLINKPVAKSHTPSITVRNRLPPLIVIGSSTGGPKALATVLAQLPANFNAAIAIVQHVDAQFTPGMVEWLNQQTPLTVKLAAEGDHLEAGQVLVAGTNNHLYLKPNFSVGYTPDPIDYPYRPSVDVFFKSVAQHWKPPGIAVLLTGMGRDGAEGLSTLRSKGWHTIAQNQATCVVYGMPKAAIELGAAVEVLSIDAIASALRGQLSISR